jgi:hypothetical protein
MDRGQILFIKLEASDPQGDLLKFELMPNSSLDIPSSSLTPNPDRKTASFGHLITTPIDRTELVFRVNDGTHTTEMKVLLGVDATECGCNSNGAGCFFPGGGCNSNGTGCFVASVVCDSQGCQQGPSGSCNSNSTGCTFPGDPLCPINGTETCRASVECN